MLELFILRNTCAEQVFEKRMASSYRGANQFVPGALLHLMCLRALAVSTIRSWRLIGVDAWRAVLMKLHAFPCVHVWRSMQSCHCLPSNRQKFEVQKHVRIGNTAEQQFRLDKDGIPQTHLYIMHLCHVHHKAHLMYITISCRPRVLPHKLIVDREYIMAT